MYKVNKLSWFARLQQIVWRNDSRWGRGDEGESKPKSEQPEQSEWQEHKVEQDNRKPGKEGPPDLEEIWNDLSSKIIKMRDRKRSGGGGNGSKPPGFDFSKFNGSNKMYMIILAIIVLAWIGSGFYIVQEGQKAVVTQFGRYHTTVEAGLNWRFPYPIQNNEIVNATQLKAVNVGDDSLLAATGLKTSGMLTGDGNIVEIKFSVQYRLKPDEGVKDFLFETRDPDAAVVQASESAVREVVGKMTMDAAIEQERDQIALRVKKLTQSILDHYKTGIYVDSVNMEQGGVRPPEKVQAAFDDVLKAEQEAERLKNEAQAYANNKVPRASGVASRLLEEARAYSAKVLSRASGDAQRFNMIVAEYKKAPKVVRDRIYTDTMYEVYQGVNKVIVDSKQNSNLLFLPLEKLLQNANGATTAPAASANALEAALQEANQNNQNYGTSDERSRGRDRRN